MLNLLIFRMIYMNFIRYDIVLHKHVNLLSRVYPLSFSGYKNIALGRRTHQSSSLSNAGAELAVDGNLDGNFYNGSCSHTAVNETESWWYVDLDRTAMVYYVNIVNRQDCCCKYDNNAH